MVIDEEYFTIPKISSGYPKGRKNTGMSRREYMKKYRQDKKKELREYNKAYQRKHYKDYPNKYLYWQIKQRAKNKGLPFDIKSEDLIIPEYCPILGIKLERNIGGLNYHQNSPSVDRIIPKLGYIKGNIQIISQKANVMKSNATPEELERFANWVTKIFLPSLKT